MRFDFVLNGFHQKRSIVSAALFLVAFLVLASSPAAAWDIKIAWDPNTEANLDGYTVYYTQNAPGPPYDYVGDLPLKELADPNYPSARVTDLEKNVSYYFALTAYDTEGNESSFSQELCVRNDESIYQCAPASTFSNNSSSGSGGTATCFIQTARDNEPCAAPPYFSFVLLGLLLAISFILPVLNSKK